MKTMTAASNLFDIATLMTCFAKVGVAAHVVEGQTFTFDLDTFKAVKNYEMPHFLYMNKKWLVEG